MYKKKADQELTYTNVTIVRKYLKHFNKLLSTNIDQKSANQ